MSSKNSLKKGMLKVSLYHKESDDDPLFKAQRKTYLNRFSYCRICGDYVLREERSIDHIIPMWRYNGDYWDKENWQMICPTCHAKKTKLEGSPEI
jgi:5-methylcytosine-specific restriction endonuclease McrA